MQAAYAPAFDALYSEHIGAKRNASSRWSLWEASNYFSIAIGALAGALVVQFASFGGLFIAMATLCAASGLCVLFSRKTFSKRV